MRRPLFSRIAALVIATLVGISAPGLALAHGYAHHEAGEHVERHDGHDRAVDRAATDELHDGPRISIQAADEPNNHAHTRLAHAVSVRMDAPLFVLPVIQAAAPVGIVFVGGAWLPMTAAPARAGPANAPPRQPRAPPLG